jgi:hypothetical protein
MKSALERLREIHAGHRRDAEDQPSSMLLAKYPPDELGERCLVCGSKGKWVWIDGRRLCRRGVIDGDHQ